MERRAKTRPAVVFWTPAPLSSEDSWEEDEEDHFLSQLDDDGVLQPSDALGGSHRKENGFCAFLEAPESARSTWTGPRADDLHESAGEEHNSPPAFCEVEGAGTHGNAENGLLLPLRRANHPAVSRHTVTASSLPSSFHSTEGESAAAPGIDADTFPGRAQSPQESSRRQDGAESAAGSTCSERRTDAPRQQRPAPQVLSSGILIRGEAEKSKQQDKRRLSRIPRAHHNPPHVDLLREKPLEPRVKAEKRSSGRTFLHSERPIVFKSPADIAKEVLFSSSRSSTPSESGASAAHVAASVVPPEFRSRPQASALVRQLQEDYNKLLTKYAEAENTIDRLRLGAKVNLFSDGPNRSQGLPSGPSRSASHSLKLSFPQTAHTSSPQAEQAGARRSPLENALVSQTEKFLQQLQTFEDLIKTEEQWQAETAMGLSGLSEGLDALEGSYLRAREEHQRLQQGGRLGPQFDPERELESLIFQCGLHVEELKERVQQQGEAEPPSAPPEEGKQSLALLPMVNSERKESMEEEEEEETLEASFYTSELVQISEVPSSVALTASEKPVREKEEQRSGGSQSAGGSPVCSQQQQQQQRLCSGPPPAGSRQPQDGSVNSSLSSLTDASSERRRLKMQAGGRSLQAQGGVVSPETDSGFLGSESSRLARSAEALFPQQRTPERGSVHVNAPPPAQPRLCSTHPKRGRRCQKRRTLSSPPQSCRARRDTTTDSGPAELTEAPCSTPPVSDTGNHGSVGTSSPAACHRHGDPRRAADPARVEKSREEFERLQAEVEALRWKLLSHLSSLNAATPRPNRFQELLYDVPQERGASHEEAERDSAGRQRATSGQTLSSLCSGPDPPTPQHWTSRCTQTSAAVLCGPGAAVRSKETQTWPRSVSSDDASSKPLPCPRCPSSSPGQIEQSVGGAGEWKGPPSCCCRGDIRLHGCTESACRAKRGVSPDGAAAPLLRPQLLLYAVPLSPPAERRRRAGGGRRRSSLDGSLDRAIRAARRMEHTSRRMACALAAGLHSC